MHSNTFVIAEAGVNHNGSFELALKMIDVAAEAGADAIKFQTFNADKLATKHARKADYQIANTQDAGSQLDMLRKLELSESDHHRLVAHCKTRGIHFMSTAFDEDSLRFLSAIDMPALKIPSGDISCAPLLLQAAQLKRPLIVSTGMCSLWEIEQALGVIAYGLLNNVQPKGQADFEAALFSKEGRFALQTNVTLLHCVSQYPASPASVNLRAMDTMSAAFGLPVGYSDHTLGIDVALAAVARGASIIEKHFTLDRTLPGPDHVASLEPDELTRMISGIRTVEQALGSPCKQPSAEELPNRALGRRSVVASRHIKAGETITTDAMTCKRPGTGISPMAIWTIAGRVASRDYQVDDLIEY